MPWFPDFIAAAELARREIRAAGRADPVAQYLTALDDGRRRTPWRRRGRATSWSTTPVPVRSAATGSCDGSSRRTTSSLAGAPRQRPRPWRRPARVGRAVVELLAHLADDEGDVLWPVAVVAESPMTISVVFRTYCSQWPVDGRRHVRAPDPRAGTGPSR